MNPINAAGAYANAAKLAREALSPDQDRQGPLADPGGFSEMLRAAVSSVTETGQAAEAKTAALASGKADVVDLVTAVSETELALETLVTVRDRVISSYQDIMNMPI